MRTKVRVAHSGALSAAGMVALAACGSPTEVAGLFLRVGGEYELAAVFATTYDCNPLDTLPRDAVICGTETAVVTTRSDTLRALLAVADFCDAEGCLGAYAVGRFTGTAHATWASYSLLPDRDSTVQEYTDLTVQITPDVIDCSAENSRRRGGGVDLPECVDHEEETIVVVGVGLEPLGVYLLRGRAADDQITGGFSNVAGTMQPRSVTSTTWTLR